MYLQDGDDQYEHLQPVPTTRTADGEGERDAAQAEESGGTLVKLDSPYGQDSAPAEADAAVEMTAVTQPAMTLAPAESGQVRSDTPIVQLTEPSATGPTHDEATHQSTAITAAETARTGEEMGLQLQPAEECGPDPGEARISIGNLDLLPAISTIPEEDVKIESCQKAFEHIPIAPAEHCEPLPDALGDNPLLAEILDLNPITSPVLHEDDSVEPASASPLPPDEDDALSPGEANLSSRALDLTPIISVDLEADDQDDVSELASASLRIPPNEDGAVSPGEANLSSGSLDLTPVTSDVLEANGQDAYELASASMYAGALLGSSDILDLTIEDSPGVAPHICSQPLPMILRCKTRY